MLNLDKITLRKTKISDAKRLYEIINNSNFEFVSIKAPSIKAEREYLKKDLVKGD